MSMRCCAHKAGAYRVDAGLIRRRSLFDHVAVFTRTLKARLITLVAAPAVFMVVMGWSASSPPSAAIHE